MSLCVVIAVSPNGSWEGKCAFVCEHVLTHDVHECVHMCGKTHIVPLCGFVYMPVCGSAQPCVCVCVCVCVCACVGAELRLCPQVTGWRSLFSFIYSGALQILTNLSL